MPDPASAQLMKVKAEHILVAGIITAAQKAEIDRRADEVIRKAPTASALATCAA